MRSVRVVEPERLDELAAGDPEAIRSRRDLELLNAWMGNAGIVARLLQEMSAVRRVRVVVELGAGDGTFLLRVARRMNPPWSGVRAVLVDRVMVVGESTRRELARLGWKLDVVTSDVFPGLELIPAGAGTVVLSNLFLHHLRRDELEELLARIAVRADGLVACEPRRSRLALHASRLVGLLGCNAGTRHDAQLSVRAGFSGRELSELWPAGAGWSLEEAAAGPFSHRFSASRTAVNARTALSPPNANEFEIAAPA